MSSAPAGTVTTDAPAAGGVPASRSNTELLRAAAWLFSFLAIVVMATDVHGRGGAHDFSTYPEYKLSSGRDLLAGRKVAAIIDFTGDQVIAYFLISGLSAAAPVTDYMRQGVDNLFDDSATAAISRPSSTASSPSCPSVFLPSSPGTTFPWNLEALV